MCVIFTSDIEITTEDIYCYKLVNAGTLYVSPAYVFSYIYTRCSLYQPSKRTKQNNRKGRLREYIKGKTMTSSLDKTFGFYCYRDFKNILIRRGVHRGIHRGRKNCLQIDILIPKGTRVIYGYTSENDKECRTINAETIKVLT